MITLRQGWMSVQSSLCATLCIFRCGWHPLSNCLKSSCIFRLKEAPVAFYIHGCLLFQPSVPCPWSLCLLPSVGKHTTIHPYTFPAPSAILIFGCKVCSFPQHSLRGLADRPAWGLVFRTSLSTKCPFGLSVWWCVFRVTCC